MSRDKVMALWTALISAIVAVLATLGLSSPAVAAPVQQTGEARNSAPAAREASKPAAAAPARYDRSLPPTMKQRIRAEAHGSSPSCRSCAAPYDFDAALAEVVNAALDPDGGSTAVPAPAPAPHTPHTAQGTPSRDTATAHQRAVSDHGPKQHGPEQHGSKSHGPTSQSPAAHRPTSHRPAASHGPATHRPASHRPTSDEPTSHRPNPHGPASHQPASHAGSAQHPVSHENGHDTAPHAHVPAPR
ncbi:MULTISPECIES: DUF6344 domain-containing protein [unclassified Streptomyces]|uniref:DUF6344 domain-containing protein n=1 Tax=unclassified Streptomyces TaxID=2593676 RepID=UPI000823BEF5|nr:MULTISPECIES: DUF6344 domain-containing protein [unclassified Streptomyces]SCK18222.1 hypothetical protein YW7DRAFT_01250 [Streptomyces sp. AmelKG-E11A]